MNRYFVFSVFAGLVIAGTAAYAQFSPLPTNTQAVSMKPFPSPKLGQKQFVINLPKQADEHAFRVGLTVGRYEQTDGVNSVGIGGKLEKKTVSGWGYSYYEVSGGSHPSMSTLMAPMPGTPPVTKFVSMQESLIRYNSRLPVVIYVPSDMEVKYRIFTAGEVFDATQNVDPSHVADGYDEQVKITSQYSGPLPNGSVATIRLYDSMLMDTDSTYGLHSLPIARLPITLPLPRKDSTANIVGPAVGVSIRDKDGRLLFINDTSTPLAENGATQIVVKSIR